jgi:hypothetical protein
MKKTMAVRDREVAPQYPQSGMMMLATMPTEK